jgi:general nucleoside transport system permease protein
MISDLFSLHVLVGILTSGVRLATSYIYAAIGEMFGQTSGVLNLGVEGQMLVAAYAAYIVVLRTGDLMLGLLAAILVGLVMGLMMAIISVTLKAEQGISGIGVYLFGLGLSDLLYRITVKSPVTVAGFPNIQIPVLTDLPILGPILFNQNILVYAAC